MGKESANGLWVKCEWDSFPGSAYLGPVEIRTGS